MAQSPDAGIIGHPLGAYTQVRARVSIAHPGCADGTG